MQHDVYVLLLTHPLVFVPRVFRLLQFFLTLGELTAVVLPAFAKMRLLLQPAVVFVHETFFLFRVTQLRVTAPAQDAPAPHVSVFPR